MTRVFLQLLLTSMLVSGVPVAYAQDAGAIKTDPLPLANPTTGEPGVWVPVWFQQEVLKTDAQLKACTEIDRSRVFQLSEQALELHETQAATVAFQKSIAALKAQLTFVRLEEQSAAARAQRNLVLAVGSAGAAVVALSILLIEHL